MCYLLIFCLWPFWPAAAELSNYIRDLVAHKTCPLQKKIAYPALDHYSALMVSCSLPVTKDVFSISNSFIYLIHYCL